MRVGLAKQRLLQAAGECTLRRWVQRHPLESVASAFLVGFIAGEAPDSRALARKSLSLLLRML